MRKRMCRNHLFYQHYPYNPSPNPTVSISLLALYNVFSCNAIVSWSILPVSISLLVFYSVFSCNSIVSWSILPASIWLLVFYNVFSCNAVVSWSILPVSIWLLVFYNVSSCNSIVSWSILPVNIWLLVFYNVFTCKAVVSWSILLSTHTHAQNTLNYPNTRILLALTVNFITKEHSCSCIRPFKLHLPSLVPKTISLCHISRTHSQVYPLSTPT